MIHSNSVASFATTRPDREKRILAILAVLSEDGELLTDRQIKDRLGFQEMNAVRPRITELLKEGRISEYGKTRCQLTGKTVRKIGLPMGQMRFALC